MRHECFTEEWAQAWQREMMESGDFRSATSKWQWPIVLMLQKDEAMGIPETRSVYLDVYHGECRCARRANADDLDTASFVISSDAATWKQVLDGHLEPFFGLIRGKLKLMKGSMLTLAPYVVAARELVNTARSIETLFPAALAGGKRAPAFHG